MQRSLATIKAVLMAACVSFLLLSAASAHALISMNGITLNGLATNGAPIIWDMLLDQLAATG
jgi:hypothetical protein